MSLVGLIDQYSNYYHFFKLFSDLSIIHSLSLLCTHPIREALKGGLSILRMEMLGVEQDRCCCCCQRLEVHITTGARLFGPGRATASGGVPVHAGTLTTRHFPIVGREGGGRNEER